MFFEFAGISDVGMKRSHNEDNLLISEDHNIFVVADGMGGHASGEVASQMAIDTLLNFYKETCDDDEITWPFKMDKLKKYEENRLIVAIKLSNLRIFETQYADITKKGMGTTLVAIYFVDSTAFIAHVGDSRLYRIRGSEMKQITEDHSLLNDYKKMKNLTPEEIEAFPHKNVIVRALGMKETVLVDIALEPVENNDIFLLCSDGLSGMIKDEEMKNTVIEYPRNLEKAALSLIEKANKAGGTDNITTILIQAFKSAPNS